MDHFEGLFHEANASFIFATPNLFFSSFVFVLARHFVHIIQVYLALILQSLHQLVDNHGVVVG